MFLCFEASYMGKNRTFVQTIRWRLAAYCRLRSI